MTGAFAAARAIRRGASLACFGLTTLSMATVGLLVPLIGTMAAATGVSSAQLGMALSLFSLPSAFGSILSGQLCDRYGARRLLLGGALMAIAADALLFVTMSAWVFGLALLLAGVAFSMVVVSAPALLIALLDGGARAKALSLWVTYAPVGVALGLLLAAPFVGQQNWRWVMAVHAALLALATLGGGRVFGGAEPGPADRSVPALHDLVALLRERTILRLGAALAVPAALSYGTSLLAPSYIAKVHHVGLGSAAISVALAKIAVVLSGGLFTGWILSRDAHPGRTFNRLWLLGLAGQALLFYPASGFVAGIAGFGLWLFAYAGISATAMTMLPVLFPTRQSMGLANGMISQMTSCASFLAPIVYFAPLAWWVFPAIALGAMALSLIALPRRG